jgi:hypothetical protein
LLSTTNDTTRSRASWGTAPTDLILMLVFARGSTVPEGVRDSCHETIFYGHFATYRQPFTAADLAVLAVSRARSIPLG